MKRFLRLTALVLLLALCLTGCDNGTTADVTATPTLEPTATPEITPDPSPTVAPTTAPQVGKVSENYFKVDESSFINFPMSGVTYENDKNVIPAKGSSFDAAASVEDTGWFSFAEAEGELVKEGTNQFLRFTSPVEWASMALELSQFTKEAANYTLSFRYRFEGNVGDAAPFYCAIRTNGLTSFSKADNGNIFMALPPASEKAKDTWQTYSASFSVQSGDLVVPRDLEGGLQWNFCVHMINANVKNICMDDFCVTYNTVKMNDPTESTKVTEAQSWVANEITLISKKTYTDPYRDVDVNMTLTNGTVTYQIPGFWDGGNIWRVRFTCPTAGTWTYEITCTDAANADLTQKGTVRCVWYDGPLAVYKRGHVTTQPNTKYFVYADGTPFFYLGDTHWNLSGEPLDHVQKISLKRVQQGFTMIQSEPLGADFELSNAVQQDDIPGLRINDDKFKDLASKGLTHANAEFFFPSSMETFIQNFGGYNKKVSFGKVGGKKMYDLSDQAKQELERLTRYWVARYSAFPVMWTLGQEVDKAFYHSGADNWTAINNPYRLVAQYIGKYDAYKHPLSGHQENTGSTKALDSALRDLPEHTWYAVQWSGSYNGQTWLGAPQEYWNEEAGQGKPAPLYEGKYCFLWTKNFGARVQGYMAYLNGMYGYGWGGQDTWSYLNTYDEQNNSSDGVDVITAQQKQDCTWETAMEFESTYQCGYMRQFFEEQVGDWYNLLPTFNDASALVFDGGAYGFCAANADKTKIVVYFYNFTDPTVVDVGGNVNTSNGTGTATLQCLEKKGTYHYEWFNPRTNEITSSGEFTATAKGYWEIGEKLPTDMVLFVYK